MSTPAEITERIAAIRHGLNISTPQQRTIDLRWALDQLEAARASLTQIEADVDRMAAAALSLHREAPMIAGVMAGTIQEVREAIDAARSSSRGETQP